MTGRKRSSTSIRPIGIRFLLSVNDVPQLRDLFAWAKIDTVSLTYTIGGGNNLEHVTELLISK